MHWLKTISRLLSAQNHRRELHERQPLEFINPTGPTLTWCQKELVLLLTAQQSGRPCYGRCQGSDLTMQSVILGFDVANNQLMLDEFVPSPAAGVIDRLLTIRLASAAASLQLQVLVTGRITFGAHAALAATVICKSFERAREPEPAVFFTAQQSPSIDLLLPMNPILRGRVLELSTERLLISAPVTNKPSLYTRQGQCQIQFAKQFHLQCTVKINNLRLLRKPNRHSLVHATFADLTEEQTEQLGYFIRQLRSPGQNPKAA